MTIENPQLTREQLREHAQKALDSEHISVLLRVKLNELTDDVMLAPDDKAALASRAEYTALLNFGEWVAQTAEEGI